MGKKVITLGEVMMRLSTPSHERFLQTDCYQVVYGGAEANVAVALALWGVHAIHVTAMPDHDIGHAASRYLRQTGVDTSQVYFKEGRMGLYFLENGTMQRASKIIYDRFDAAFSHFEGNEVDWNRVFDGADWFHWTGITPALSEKAAKLTLSALKAAQKNGVKVSADINYRRNLWQYGKSPLEVMPELIEYSNVLVAGLTDFENCMDIHEKTYEKACETAQQLNSQITHVTTTHRDAVSASHNALSAVLWENGKLIRSKSYEMTHIVDRIGGGDAYMAGLIYGLLHLHSQEALEFAVASSVLKHSIPGDANLVSLQEVEALVKGENVGKLLR
ncbi:sugar kinase [Pararhodonellum marinum]|uniref:sugar kinase n=1 Tax=Pararhodonellum marinum TaxID=2755358 RepID=UPI00188DCE2A|nr:sugar kinase [Pararhodonellum marinum]